MMMGRRMGAGLVMVVAVWVDDGGIACRCGRSVDGEGGRRMSVEVESRARGSLGIHATSGARVAGLGGVVGSTECGGRGWGGRRGEGGEQGAGVVGWPSWGWRRGGGFWSRGWPFGVGLVGWEGRGGIVGAVGWWGRFVGR